MPLGVGMMQREQRMQLVRCIKSPSAAQIGVVSGTTIVALADLAPDTPQDTRALILDWDAIAPKLTGADQGEGTSLDQIVDLNPEITLKPGDLNFTGTPGGVGVAMQPPIFLNEG